MNLDLLTLRRRLAVEVRLVFEAFTDTRRNQVGLAVVFVAAFLLGAWMM